VLMILEMWHREVLSASPVVDEDVDGETARSNA